jgi:hypothetical protein
MCIRMQIRQNRLFALKVLRNHRHLQSVHVNTVIVILIIVPLRFQGNSSPSSWGWGWSYCVWSWRVEHAKLLSTFCPSMNTRVENMVRQHMLAYRSPLQHRTPNLSRWSNDPSTSVHCRRTRWFHIHSVRSTRSDCLWNVGTYGFFTCWRKCCLGLYFDYHL